MSFVDALLRHASVSIVGMEKNTGKTECLKYILRRARTAGHTIAVTSIGLDGETCDQVTGTSKPEIVLHPGMLFVTAEKFFLTKRMAAEIIDVTDYRTAVGRLVTARAVTSGKVIISGPTDTGRLREVIAQLQHYGADTCFVDGALSRKSLASPAVTDAMVLTTGAALSPNLNELIRKTHYIYSLINLPRYETPMQTQLLAIDAGIWAITTGHQLHDLEIHSALLLKEKKHLLFQYGHTIFVSGIVTDSLLEILRMQPEIAQIQLVVKDFTKIFATPMVLHNYLSRGGRLSVLLSPQLLGVCLNPVSPSGYVLNSEHACAQLSEKLGIPVWDVRREDDV